jgi:hypothetical protein
MSMINSREKTPVLREMGGRSMIPATARSKPRPMSGRPEVAMIIHMIWTGAMGKTERPVRSLKTRPTSKTIA